jgi:glycosyltransferase involved in cell wall biosynthesis
MKNDIIQNPVIQDFTPQNFFDYKNLSLNETILMDYQNSFPETSKVLAQILFVTSYPPRECGIATYSQDLIKALNNKFSSSLSINVCALETGNSNFPYSKEVKYILNTSKNEEYKSVALNINSNQNIKIVLIQHEFGFFREQEESFLQFLFELTKPIIIVFHTVLPHPDELLKAKIKRIAAACESIIVMTANSAKILLNEYEIPDQKINIIAHGTHLVPHLSEKSLKTKYGLENRKVLTTFGLLSSGKSIETTLNALPTIIKSSPEVLFLVIGKTHPEVVKHEGEKYRQMLEEKVVTLKLQDHVKFINNYLALPELLEYLQLTDIYLFTSNDPNQAVSGTFAYAMGCACPIISTPIPHALELLTKDTGIIFDFNDSQQLAECVTKLLKDNKLRKHLSTNALQRIISTSWENSSISHAKLFETKSNEKIALKFNLPEINLNHLKKMTTSFGMIQFSKINQPDIKSGYTIDDNARALIALCMYFDKTQDKKYLININRYLSFLEFCMQPAGDFLNYVDENHEFTSQNNSCNLDDSNGRAIWSLGYLVSLKGRLPADLVLRAEVLFDKSRVRLSMIHSTRAMAFAIKGLYYFQGTNPSDKNLNLISIFASRLLQMYKHESAKNWEWFESYLTYANSVLPEAMLYSWLLTGKIEYKDVALSSFNFLLKQTFNKNGIEVISNKTWLQKGETTSQFGQQPIDVAYTIMTLSKFYDVFIDEKYFDKMIIAFDWFLGKNRLNQIIYNPCTGGCYDGLEENYVNLNQGAESTISYLIARLTLEKYTPLIA